MFWGIVLMKGEFFFLTALELITELNTSYQQPVSLSTVKKKVSWISGAPVRHSNEEIPVTESY